MYHSEVCPPSRILCNVAIMAVLCWSVVEECNKERHGEHSTECEKVQIRHIIIELFRQEVDSVSLGRGFPPIQKQIFVLPTPGS